MKIWTIFIILIFSADIFTQAPNIEWTKTFGGNLIEKGYCVRQTTDGGYIITGITASFSSGIPTDIWLLKTDAVGDSMWSKIFGSSTYAEAGQSVEQTSDGGYIVCGYGAAPTGRQVWLIKTNASGDSLWTKTFGGSDYDEGYSVQQTSDGGYVITGLTRSFGNGLNDVWLIKTDTLGIVQWTKTFGGTNDDAGYSVEQTADGGYIIAGSTWSFGAGSGDFWLIKADANGDSLWTKTFGGIHIDEARSVQQTRDDGYIITGYTSSQGEGGDLWLVKTDINGDTLWTKNYGGIAFDRGYSVWQTSDGGYIVGGSWVGSDFWIVKTDATGDSLWTITVHVNNETCYSIQQTSDGGYIATGELFLGGPNTELWLLKIEPDLTGIGEDSHWLTNTYQLYQNYPNPFNPVTKISWKSPISGRQTLKLFDILGNEVATLVDEYKPSGTYEIDFDAKELASGMYLYKLTAGDFVETRKMLLLK